MEIMGGETINSLWYSSNKSFLEAVEKRELVDWIPA